MDRSDDVIERLVEAARGNRDCLGELFERYRARLLAAVQLRLSPEVKARVDAADVVQESFIDAVKRFDEFVYKDAASLYVWLRTVTLANLIDIHRHHLGVQARDARREVSMWQTPFSGETSTILAHRLRGDGTSPSGAAIRAESIEHVVESLDGLAEQDREVLVLRHLEQMTHAEVAAVLKISEETARKRHLRALMRLRELLRGEG